MTRTDTETAANMSDKVTSSFLTCKVDANLTQDEQRKVVQSVELTKALVLMGYMKWSELEPGLFNHILFIILECMVVKRQNI